MIFRFKVLFFAKHVSIFHVFFILVFGCSIALSQPQNEQRYTYYEFDGIFVFYKTQDVTIYRELLPEVFEMPDEPLVMAYIMDFYKMDKATQPYLEAAVFLLAKYEGNPAWHCITMPVTSDEARIGGIYYLGYPKIIGDITLQRSPFTYIGTLNLKGKTIMTITHDTKGHSIASEEEHWFQKLKGIPILSILNGRIIRPMFGSQDRQNSLLGQYSPLEISRMFPEKFQIKVGKSTLFLDHKAAGEHSEKLASIFSIKPTHIVLAFYLDNKFVSRISLF